MGWDPRLAPPSSPPGSTRSTRPPAGAMYPAPRRSTRGTCPLIPLVRPHVGRSMAVYGIEAIEYSSERSERANRVKGNETEQAT